MYTRIFLFLLISFTSALEAFYQPVEFVIVTPSYNNELWCEQSLQSLASQTYPYWSLVYINDCSTDRTGARVEQFIKQRNLSYKCTVIHNKKRKGAMANFYRAINKLPGRKVVVNLDGDDKLAHPQVLERLANVYANKKVWMTYGNYREEPNHIPSVCVPFDRKTIKKRAFRSLPWTASHLKTYYAKLFQKIKKKDLLYRGRFMPVASDLAFMFPMLEMASQNHIRYIPEILYLYNRNNPLNDQRLSFALVSRLDKKIRNKKKYRAVRKLF